MKATERARAEVPCASDEHVFRPEAYELPVGDRALDDERCTICGWSWDDIAEHEAGICCCPADHSSRPPEKLR